jgi:hypothetical protein
LIGLAAAAAMIAGVFGPWQVWEEGAPVAGSTTTSGMSYGVGWLVVGAAVIGAVELLAFALGCRWAALATVIAGLGAVLLTLPGGRTQHLVLDRAQTEIGWGYWVTLSASLLLISVGPIALTSRSSVAQPGEAWSLRAGKAGDSRSGHSRAS